MTGVSHFVKDGPNFIPMDKRALDTCPVLPVGDYCVKYDSCKGHYYLESLVKTPETFGKIYGSMPKDADRIFNTYKSRSNNTGILLEGEKGSGKTLLARLLCQKATSEGIPVIYVNEPFWGEEFNQFLQRITQQAVVIFDEFEKVYELKDQDKMLTILDGVYRSKKLFIFTCNTFLKISNYMINRPGRIYYNMNFTGLSAAFIQEYCDENLENKTYTQVVARLSQLFENFNFDMLKSLIEEMNRYKESPIEVLNYLNIKPFSEDFNFNVTMTVDGAKVKCWPAYSSNHPLMQKDITINHELNDDECTEVTYTFAQKDLVKSENNIYQFKSECGKAEVFFTRDFKRMSRFELSKLF